MTGLGQYIGGLLLCLVVSLVYSMTRKDTPATIAKETFVVLLYIIGAIAVVSIAVMLMIIFAAKFK